MNHVGLQPQLRGAAPSTYLSYYGLEVEPFQQNPDPRFLWRGDKQNEALTALRSGILENRGLLLLTGDIGTGKTTLTNALIEALPKEVVIGRVPYPRLEAQDFFRVIADAYNLTRAIDSRMAFLDELEGFLAGTAVKEQPVLLVIDEAQSLSAAVFDEIRQLAARGSILNILLVGHPELNPILSQAAGTGSRVKAAITRTIDSLTAAEVGAYIRHRLRVAGTDGDLFGPGAVNAIGALSRGIPREINTICGRALVRGYESGLKTIDSDTIRDCGGTVGIADPEPPRAVGGAPLPPSPRSRQNGRGRPRHEDGPVRLRSERRTNRIAPMKQRPESSGSRWPLRAVWGRRSAQSPVPVVSPDGTMRGRRLLAQIRAALPGAVVLLAVGGYLVYSAGRHETEIPAAATQPVLPPSQEPQSASPPTRQTDLPQDTAERSRELMPSSTSDIETVSRRPAGSTLPAAPVARATPGEILVATPPSSARLPSRAPLKAVAPEAPDRSEKPTALGQERRVSAAAEWSAGGQIRQASNESEGTTSEPVRPARIVRAPSRESADSGPDPSGIIDWLLKEYVAPAD